MALTFRKNIPTLISLMIIIPIGFYGKFYQGPGAYWVNNSFCGVFYEIFWCLLFFSAFPKSPGKIALSVFIMTSALEFLQLWHPYSLEVIRSYFIGRTILGTSFTWNDFPYYVVGSTAGWVWMLLLQRKVNLSSL